MRVLLVLVGTIIMLFGIASGGCAIRVLIDGMDVPLEHLNAVDFLVPVVSLAIGAGLTWVGGVMFHGAFRPRSRSIVERSPSMSGGDAADTSPMEDP